MNIIRDVFSSVEKTLNDSISTNITETTTVKTPGDLIQAGDVEITDIVLMSEDQSRQYNLIAQVASFEVYESIMSPVIFCELHIADSAGILQSFPITGESLVRLNYKTPKNKDTGCTYIFRVNKVMNKQVNESNKRLVYTLQLVSAEIIRNSVRLVNKKTKDSIDNMIKTIVDEDLQTDKAFNVVDKTAGIEEIIITRMQPFKAIDFLRQRAVSSEYTSSSFCFFENKKGYNFTTIEHLFELGKKNEDDSDKIFFFDTTRKDSIKDVTIRNIIAYNQLTFGDTISQAAMGGLTNQIQEFDLVTGNLRRLTYTDNIGADKFKLTSDKTSDFNTTGFSSRHGKSTAITKIIPIRSDKNLAAIPEKLSALQAFAQKITQNITQIYIYGDTDITVGDMITCYFPSGIDSKNATSVSRLDSGNYLVTKVRHIILNGDRPQYTMALELIKNDLEDNV